MTFILVDKADRGRELQLANRVWDCVVSNVEREWILPPETTDFLRVWAVGQLGPDEAAIFATTIRDRFLLRLTDGEVLFLDGRTGSVGVTGQGFAAETPYHLVSHVSKETLEELLEFASVSRGFDVC